VISIVDPDARHGHKTQARGFDGYKDRFDINLDTATVTCPAGSPRPSVRSTTSGTRGSPSSVPPAPPTRCSLLAARQCTTTTAAGRTITIGHYEAALAVGRARQTDPVWKADYRATRPRSERKTCHLMRRLTAAPRPGPRTSESGRRLLTAGRRDQPRPIRRAGDGV
jgi:hypothetical protein